VIRADSSGSYSTCLGDDLPRFPACARQPGVEPVTGRWRAVALPVVGCGGGDAKRARTNALEVDDGLSGDGAGNGAHRVA